MSLVITYLLVCFVEFWYNLPNNDERNDCMKLNPDCIRDILLLAEKETSLDFYLDISPNELPESLIQ